MQANYYVINGVRCVGRQYAVLTPTSEIERLARSCSFIPPAYFVATAKHETNCATNEVDVEDSGFTSQGLYQISDGHGAHGYVEGDDECTPNGFVNVNLLEPKISTAVFAVLQAKRMERLIAAWRETNPTAVELIPDLYAYLALAHNEGIGAAEKTIRAHGADWVAYKTRNGACQAHRGPLDMTSDRAYNCQICTPYIRRIGAYGDDCMEGV